MPHVSTRWILVFGLVFASVAGAVVLLLREDPGTEPAAPVARDAGADASEEARLQGIGDAGAVADYREADVATTLSAFRFQPPNVVAGAVARLRQHVTDDPALLQHLVRAALTLEELRSEYIEPDYPYDGRSLAIWAVEALGRTAVPLLIAHLEQEEDTRRRSAIRAILRVMGEEAAPAVGALRRHLGDTERSDHERADTILTLSLVGPAAAEAVPELLRILRGPDDPLLDAALQAIYRIAGMTDDVRDAFIDLLAIEDADLRVDVLQVVVDQLGTDVEPLRPTLVGLVEHGGPDVRRLALWALAPVGVQASGPIQLVGQRLEDGDEDEEAAALAVLLASGDRGRRTLLEIAQRTELVPLALRVTGALVEDGAEGEVPPGMLLRLFRECDLHVLHRVVAVLNELPGGVPADDALPTLRTELGDPESDRRWAAVEALSAVRGDDDAVLTLLEAALEDPEVRDFAFGALGRLVRLEGRVVPILERLALAGRLDAVNQLGTLALRSALARAALQRLTAADDPELRDFAGRVSAEVDAASPGG